ncbi:hypothetical protein [Mycobacterium tuberculosis]|uniref:hypothetical protein n=1 Tax=Mycobacterium tuberculosis TaxID=1773 RepID=UPI00272CC2B1|nr:hypothetical protein [Mycobacterium tuberculosis]
MQTDRLVGLVAAPFARHLHSLTVRAADGRWCREFRDGAKTALACRGDKGWTIEGEAA